MANIKNLTMGSLLLSDPRITTVSTLFGLSSKAVYVPTGSKISSSVYEYSAQEEDKLKHLLPLTGAALADAARNVKTLKSHDIGNLRLEVCVSADPPVCCHAALPLQQLRRHSRYLSFCLRTSRRSHCGRSAVGRRPFLT